jgi:hypothetical protein
VLPRAITNSARNLANPDMMSWLKPSATHSAACELALKGMTRSMRAGRGVMALERLSEDQVTDPGH